ncbi:MAG: hypothetical protein J6D15_05815 [Clostridia bacterium]|nr:hypothetical protein [Clostridia bacterium]
MSVPKWANAKQYKEHIKENKGPFVVYVLLRGFVILSMVISCLRGNYENLFFCALALVLFLLPAFFEKNFGIDLPNILEIVILLFIFASVILGEMGSYYTKVPFWDTVLHTVNGFLCAAIGFGLSDILNRNDKIKFKLSPVFLAVVAFCFSMTIGVLWEFFEFFCDVIVKTDMQKDAVVSTIVSTALGESTKEPKVIENIKAVAVNGIDFGIDGYLDIGLFDTMKDLLVNFIGAAVFSVIGFVYVKSRGKSKIAKHFIPTVVTPIDVKEKSYEDENKGN